MLEFRKPVRTGLASGALLLVAAACGSSRGPSAPAALEGCAPVDGFARCADFAEPPELRSEDGVLRVTLRSARTGVTVGDRAVEGEVYNDAFVGPTLRLKPGDRLELTLVNALQQPTNLHFHGLHVSPEGLSDNIFRMIAPGETAQYVVEIPANHQSGTFWYHSHMHMLAEQQVFGGLSGVIIIEGLEAMLPAGLQGVRARTLALKDLQVADGAILAENIDSNAPTTRTVNALVEPVIALAPGATELWRLANIGADIFYDAALDGHTFTVVAEDGNPVTEFWTAEHLVLPPGKRFDVLVQPTAAGSFALRTRAYDQGGDQYPDVVLARVEVAGAAVPPAALPTGAFAAAFAFPAVVAQRTQVFSEDDTAGRFFINGKEFDENRVDVEPKLDTAEEWTLRNETSEQHPFHIHVNDFTVLSVNGQPYPARGRQDTVVLPANGEVVVRIPFTDFPGRFVFHCHILAHEDAGMMAVVRVVP